MPNLPPRERSHARRLELIVILSIALVLIIIAGVLASRHSSTPGSTPTGIAALSASPSSVSTPPATAVAAFSPAAAVTAPPGYSPAKATAYVREQEAHLTAVARAPHPTKPAYVPLPPQTPGPGPTMPAGLVNHPLPGPFSSDVFLVRNVWTGPVGSTWLQVYAGAARKVPGGSSLGAAGLRIYSMTATGAAMQYLGFFPAPTASGPLSISAVNGTIVQLRTDSGQSLAFNLTSLQYQ